MIFALFKSIGAWFLGKANKPLMPESLWKVKIEDGKIISVDYQGGEHTIGIGKLKSVKIRTTDEGPWGTDVWWILEDETAQAIIPGGATGEKELFGVFEKIPGYQDDAVIKAMGCTSNRIFIVYQR